MVVSAWKRSNIEQESRMKYLLETWIIQGADHLLKEMRETAEKELRMSTKNGDVCLHHFARMVL